MSKADLQIIINSLLQIKDLNDSILAETKKLRIILLNLKIEQAKLTQLNGIKPIADELERLIIGIENEVAKVVNADTTHLTKSFENLMRIVDVS